MSSFDLSVKKSIEELGDDYGESVEFITITVDPVRDTPERLASFAENNKADWRFLTSVSNDSFGDMVSVWADYRVYVTLMKKLVQAMGIMKL